MKGRIERLAVKVTQLDSNVEEGKLSNEAGQRSCTNFASRSIIFVFRHAVSLQDIHMRKAFKSSVVYEQQVVTRDTIPVAMAGTYTHCDRPPPLEKLNPYR